MVIVAGLETGSQEGKILVSILCVPDEVQADMIIDILRKQEIHAVKRYIGLGGGSFGYSAFALEIYVYEADFKKALEIVSAMNESLTEQEVEELAENAVYSEENEDEELSFGQWGLKKADLGWKEAKGHIKRFIISEEQRGFKSHVCTVCIICAGVLAFFCLCLYMYELSSLENIKYQRSRAQYYGESAKTSVAEGDNESPNLNLIPDERTVKNRYLLGYLFITGLVLFIAYSLIKMYYAEFDDFRTQKLRICYGRCIGKESVYGRYGSHFSLEICLDDKTVLKDVPVRERVCKNVENGDWLILANIEGPVKGPEPVDEIDGVYYYPEYKEKHPDL